MNLLERIVTKNLKVVKTSISCGKYFLLEHKTVDMYKDVRA